MSQELSCPRLVVVYYNIKSHIGWAMDVCIDKWFGMKTVDKKINRIDYCIILYAILSFVAGRRRHVLATRK